MIEKIFPLLPEYVKMLNTTPDNLYVTYIADTYMFRCTKHTSMDENLVVMSIEDTKISYIVLAGLSGIGEHFLILPISILFLLRI